MANESKIVLANKQNGTTTEIIDNNISSASKKFYLPNTGGKLLTEEKTSLIYLAKDIAESTYRKLKDSYSKTETDNKLSEKLDTSTYNTDKQTFATKTDLSNGLNTKANANATVNLTGDQAIAGVKTFSSVPVCAKQPTNANQVANKAYVDAIAATKAGFVIKTLTIGSGGNIANLSEFRLYAIRNFAHYYILSLVSDIEETEALSFSGINFGFNSSNYTITFKKNVNFSYGTFYFGSIRLKIDTQLDESIVFSNCFLNINGDLTFTDTFNSEASLSTAKLGGISLVNTNAYFGDGDTWNITTAKRHFIVILGSRIQVGNVIFNGNLASGKELFYFARQGILMTQNSTFNNLTVTGIAQNAISNKGIWIKE